VAFGVALAFAGILEFCFHLANLTQTAFAGPIPASGDDLEGLGGSTEELDKEVMVTNSVMISVMIFGSAEIVILIGLSTVIVTVVLRSILGLETGEMM